MGLRKIIRKITSPIFVPIRKFVVWSDTKFGTCDMKLTLEPRWNDSLVGFADMDDGVVVASELMKKVSKDKANLETFESQNKSSIGNSFPPQKLINNLRKNQQEEE